MTGGGNTVSLKLRRRLGRGAYVVTSTARVDGCPGRVQGSGRVRLGTPSLPVRAAVRGSAVEGDATVVRVLVRSVGGQRSRNVRLQLRGASGTVLASARVTGTLTRPVDVSLRASGRLTAGSYRLVVTGRASGTSTRSTQPLVLKGTEDASTGVTPKRQHAVINWSNGKPDGHDVVGFALPGIGHGEMVCTPDTQWVRVYPTDPQREVSMMNWTYRDWKEGSKKELREGLHTRNTGPDFSERFAAFLPAEKRSTGEFIGLISERGPFATVGTGPFAPPVSLRVAWAWDFSTAGSERCYAEIDLIAQTADAAGPAVGSAQVVWRGDAAAPGRDVSTTEVPGVGRLTVVCQAGVGGQRTAVLETGRGGTIITRQSTWDGSVPQAFGPLVVRLPNNGQVQVDVQGGAKILISSRWKVNDPDPAQNSCAVAAQVVGA